MTKKAKNPYPTRKKRTLTQASTQFEYEQAALLEWIGQKLFDVRLRHKIDQADLAKKMGIPQSYFSQIENASRDLRVSTLLRIAVALDSDLKSWLPTKRELEDTAYAMGGWGVKRNGSGFLKK